MNLTGLIQLFLIATLLTIVSCKPDVDDPVIIDPDIEDPNDNDPDDEDPNGENTALVTISEIHFTNEKDAQLIIIQASGSWNITADEDWIQCTQTTGTGKTGILVGAALNSGFPRKGNLQITSGAKQHTIAINQAGASQINFTIGETVFKMVLVEGGSFSRSDYAKSYISHTVQLDSFYMADSETTNALWKAVTGGLTYDSMAVSIKDNPDYTADELPLSYVSYYDIIERFLPLLNQQTQQHFRLPTEAEWEWAARGGNKSQQFRFAGSNEVNEVAWNYGNSIMKKHKTRQLKANELGLYDMSGNVSEWCSDWFGEYPTETVKNPQGPASGELRVMRGGNFNSSSSFGDNVECRTDYRYYLVPSCYEVSWPGTEYERVSYRCETVGFRLALSVP